MGTGTSPRKQRPLQWAVTGVTGMAGCDGEQFCLCGVSASSRLGAVPHPGTPRVTRRAATPPPPVQILTLVASRTSLCSWYRMCRMQRTRSMGHRSYVFCRDREPRPEPGTEQAQLGTPTAPSLPPTCARTQGWHRLCQAWEDEALIRKQHPALPYPLCSPPTLKAYLIEGHSWTPHSWDSMPHQQNMSLGGGGHALGVQETSAQKGSRAAVKSSKDMLAPHNRGTESKRC